MHNRERENADGYRASVDWEYHHNRWRTQISLETLTEATRQNAFQIAAAVQNAHYLKRLRLGTVDDHIRVHSEETYVLARQVLPRMACSWKAR